MILFTVTYPADCLLWSDVFRQIQFTKPELTAHKKVNENLPADEELVQKENKIIKIRKRRRIAALPRTSPWHKWKHGLNRRKR